MDQVQQWFERLVGVTPENRTRRYVTEPLFRQPLFDAAALQTPACWRRKSALVRPTRGQTGR